MIKILQLTSLKCGGAESVLINYYKSINRDMIQFDFLIVSDEKEFYEEEVLSLGGHVYKINPNNKLQLGWRMLRELSGKGEYKAIEIHTENAHSIVWVLLAYLTGFKKVIVHSHSTSNVKITEHRIAKFFLNMFPIIRFSCGEAATNFMFGKKKAYIVNNAIDISKYIFNESVRKEIREKYVLEDCFVIGHVGRFIELKNHILLLRVCEKMIKKGVQVKLLLLGDGELRQHIELQAKEMGINQNVIFTGNVRNVNEYLQGMDMFILPSFYEGFPTVAVEAQAAGLRCLLSDTITKNIDVTGLVSFFDIKKSVDELVNEIQMLSEYNRQDMSQCIQKSGLDINTEANKLYEVYKLIGEKNTNEIKSIYSTNNMC